MSLMSKALIIAATALAFVDAERLRGNGQLSVDEVMRTTEAPDPADPKDIKEKWDKMDDFLGIMFEIACKWKHGKDVNGLAAEKVKNGDITGKEAKAFKANKQAKNVVELKQACGKIVGKGKKNCRQSCADRWGKDMQTRNSCDGKCVRAYANFEGQCRSKADNLAKVYSMKLNAADARKQCYEGWCERFPTVWLKANGSEQDTEVTARCDSYCGDAQIKKRCETKWVLQVDFITGDVAEQCFKNSTSATDCFDGNKTAIETNFTTCKSDGEGTCGTQHTNCTTEGETSTNLKEAKGFCDDRKKMCEDQVSKHCLSDNKKSLEKAKTSCEKDQDTAVSACNTKTLAEKENSTISKCETDDKPVCDSDCKDKCKVTKMNTCLKSLESDHDPAQDFCQDFWKLLHESSEVDPSSGMPIVLLSPKVNVTSDLLREDLTDADPAY